MSKIFEALKRAGGEAAEVALPLIADQSPATAAADDVVEEASSPPAAAAAPAAPAASPLRPQIRTLPIRLSPSAPVLPFDMEESRAGEQYRIIRTKIVQHIEQPRIMVVSSAGPGDGKTVSALNISGALSLKNDSNVLLVDADFRRSNIADLLGLDPVPGLAEVLQGTASLEQAVVRVEQFPNLYVLPAGSVASNPTELLDSPRWTSLCGIFRRQFRFTVLDSPPIGAVADYDLIQAACDGVLVVVRPDHTNRPLCLKALQLTQGKLLGVVMNCVDRWFLWKTQDYYYYSNQKQ